MRLCPIKQVGPMGSVAVVTLLMIASIQPARAGMCACCVDPGERYERTGKLYDFEFEIINNLKLYAVARLYSTDAFPHGFKGMSAADESTLQKTTGSGLPKTAGSGPSISRGTTASEAH